MNGKEKHFYQFKSFRLDVGERQLLNNNKPVPLTPKAFDVIAFLVQRAGYLVEKEELMQAVWPDSFVEEGNVPRIIHTIRRVLGEDQNGNKFIETVATKGYRFVAEVNEFRETVSEPPALVGRLIGAALPPPAYAGGSDFLHDGAAYPTTSKAKQKRRIILFTVGFVCAIALVFLLSFNFQSVFSVKSNKGKSTPQGRYTTNDEAYRLYLLGCALTDKLNRDDARKAIEAFEQAVTLDPNYAPAYARLANVHTAVAFMPGGNPIDEYLAAKTAIDKAFAIDENLAEAHSYFGEMKTNFEWDFAGAESEHKRAVELNPDSADARRMYSLLLIFLGRADESVAEIKTAIDLEPATVLNHKIYQQNAFYARYYDESIAEGKRILKMETDFYGVYDTLVGCYRMKGDDDEAFNWFLLQHNGDKPDEIESWKTIYAQSGWSGIYERQLEQAKESEKKGKPNLLALVRLYAKTGNPEQAFIYLEKAYVERVQGLTSLKASPNYDPLRSDPRFDDLLKRIRLK